MKRYTSDQIKIHLLSFKEKEEKDLAKESLNFINEKVELKLKKRVFAKDKTKCKNIDKLIESVDIRTIHYRIEKQARIRLIYELLSKL